MIGKAYFVKGAGGWASKQLLAAAGANCVRTWSIESDLGTQLDEAEALGLTVVAGHWFGHTRHGFDYGNPEMLSTQVERVQLDVPGLQEPSCPPHVGAGN